VTTPFSTSRGEAGERAFVSSRREVVARLHALDGVSGYSSMLRKPCVDCEGEQPHWRASPIRRGSFGFGEWRTGPEALLAAKVVHAVHARPATPIMASCDDRGELLFVQLSVPAGRSAAPCSAYRPTCPDLISTSGGRSSPISRSTVRDWRHDAGAVLEILVPVRRQADDRVRRARALCAADDVGAP